MPVVLHHRAHETQKNKILKDKMKGEIKSALKGTPRLYPIDSILPVLSSKQDANRTATLFPSFYVSSL